MDDLRTRLQGLWLPLITPFRKTTAAISVAAQSHVNACKGATSEQSSRAHRPSGGYSAYPETASGILKIDLPAVT